jgi:large subunit ribosomal protein L25
MTDLKLGVEQRSIFGKSVAGLRRQGKTPGVVYGPGMKTVALAVATADLERLLTTMPENAVVTLRMPDGKELPVLVHEVTRGFVKRELMHIDFYRFSAEKKVRVHVPLQIIGVSHAPEVEGVLVQSMEKLEAECLPTHIPESISIDISSLQAIGDTLYVKDLTLPEGVSCRLDPQTPVASITEQEKEVVAPAPVVPEAEPAEGAATGETPEAPQEKQPGSHE